MKLLVSEKLLENGKTVFYHRVLETESTLGDPSMIVKMGSWKYYQEAMGTKNPEWIFKVEVPDDPENYFKLLEVIKQLPEWSDSELIETDLLVD